MAELVDAEIWPAGLDFSLDGPEPDQGQNAPSLELEEAKVICHGT
jgi:hypothetical protein